MNDYERLRAAVTKLRERAHNAPRSTPSAPSTAWARHSREWAGAIERLKEAEQKKEAKT